MPFEAGRRTSSMMMTTTPIANVLGLVFFAVATWLLYSFARKITRDSDRESAAK